MSCGNLSKGIMTGQMMVDRTPSYGRKSNARRENQVMSKKTGMIRPDKRKKAKYL